MENLLIISLFVLGLASYLVQLKVKEKFYQIFIYLFIVLLCVFSLRGFESQSEGVSLVSFLLLYTSIHLIINLLFKKKRIELISVLGIAFFLLFYQDSIVFQEYTLLFDFKNLLILPLIGAVFPFVIHFKSKLFNTFFKQTNLEESVNLIALGFLVFLALFFGSSFGLLILSISYFVSEIHLNKFKDTKSYYSFYLFLLSFLLILIKDSEIEIASFVHGSSLLGLLIGSGIAIWINKFKNNDEQNHFLKFIYFLIPIALIFTFIFIEIIKEHSGGLSAFTGIVLGFVLRDKQIHKSTSLSVMSIAFGMILVAIPYLKPKEVKLIKNTKLEALKTNNAQSESSSSFELPGKSMSELNGEWKIVSEKSKLDFELGPKDTRTKGTFKTIEGTFKFDTNFEKSVVNVVLPMSGFSTFNSYRDKALMEKDFFHFDEFPNLSFTSKNTLSANDKYIVNGDFILKGIKQNLEIEYKIVSIDKDNKGEFILIVGKSSLDRTKHKMQSDPKIGDLVDFTFELELRK
jgi:polyisoprenoid-binding protein YceI